MTSYVPGLGEGQHLDDDVTDEEFKEAMRKRVLTVGKILDKLGSAEARGLPARLKAKEVTHLVEWIKSIQDINTVMEAQMQSLGEAYMQQAQEIEKLRKSGPGKIWRPEN